MTAISNRYVQLGGASGRLGEALTAELQASDGVGRYNHYQHGSIYWTHATGAHEVYGSVRARWAELRWEHGLLGYPISTPYTEMRGSITFEIARFQHGKIEVNTQSQRVYVEKFASVPSPNYSIPVVAYRVSDDDGSRPSSIQVGEVRQWLDEANRVYAAAGIRFTFDGTLIELRNTDVNNLPAENVESTPRWPVTKAFLNRLAAQQRGVIIIFRFGPDAIQPVGGGFSDSNYDFVAMGYFDAVNLNALSILAHELGHHFGLPHTFGRKFDTSREAEDYVLSARPIEEFDGDRSLIDDTPPDPLIDELNNNISIESIILGGQAFALARKNIMSWWNHGGKGQFSHSQIDRVRQIVLERRSHYLNVTVISPVNCAALLAKIAALEIRLAELDAKRDAETDPLLRRKYYGQIVTVTNQIKTLTAKARSAGCI